MASAEKEGSWGTEWERHRPIGGVVLTMVALIAWLVFILVYTLYWSTGFTLFQNIIVTLVTLMITGMVIGLGWVVWGFRHAKHWMNQP